MIISKDTKKALDKVQHPFMVKVLKKQELAGTYLNIIKSMHKNHIASVALNGKNCKHFL